MTQHESKKITKIRKSANVRTSIVGHGLRALQTVDASLAAFATEQLFLTAKRHPTPAREKAWIEGATRFEVRDGKRHLAAWAWGEGPSVLLAHGWAGRGSQLGAFVRPLVERGFRVVTWDAPGHGASSDRLTSIPAFRDALLAVAKIAGPLHAVVAHSAGSVGTTLACHRGLEVDRLVYLSPVLDPSAWLPQATEALGLRPEIATMVRSRLERRVGERLATINRLTATPIDDLPLLVVHDRLDREVPWQDGRAIAENWPQAELISTRGLGHRRILRDDDVIASAIGFLCRDRSVSRRSA